MPDLRGQNPHEKSLQRSDSPFEAVLFRLPAAHETVYAGLGILPPLRDVESEHVDAGGTAQIAVDFGTSNTIVYCRRGEGTAEPLHFTPRLRRFNDHRDERGAHADDEAEYTAFMPGAQVKQPFATVMQIRTADEVADAWREALEPDLWRDYAFFDPDVLHLTEHLLSSGKGQNLVFDLKWGTEDKDRARIGRYLRHIAMLSLAEVVGHRHQSAPSSVRWHFSYPAAAPDDDAYREIIGSAAKIQRKGWNEVEEYHKESHAALDYFISVEGARPQAMLVLDIGGGSTDIALTGRESGKWQHSVRLAGDHLMTEFLLYNRDVLRDLGVARCGKAGVFGDQGSLEAFMRPVEDQPPSPHDRNAARAIINSPTFGRVFTKDWPNFRDSQALKLLKVGASLMMGGICAFLQKQIGSLLIADSASLDARDLTSVRLCFGGRGSTLFKLWKDDDTFGTLRGYLSESLDLEVEVQPYFSRDMKHEVAKGMLALEKNQIEFPSNNPRVVGVGARLGEQVDATAFIDDIMGRNRDGAAPEVELDWGEFGAFLDRVGEDCGFRLIHWRQDARDDIMAKGRDAFARILRDERGEMESPFIVMLRKTLSLLYERRSFAVTWNPPRRG